MNHRNASITSGQLSWSIQSDIVSTHLTCAGGHLGPASFHFGSRTIEPFSIAPWAEEVQDGELPTILSALRGDFFCCPFGIDREEPYRGEATPPHGESCNADWQLVDISETKETVCLTASLETQFRPGRIVKEILLHNGHTAIYQRHKLEGLEGPLTLGHHPMLRFPEQEGCGLISTSGFKVGQVFPEDLGNPAEGSYSALKPGAQFHTLEKVALANGGETDLSCFPARRGYDDIVQLLTSPTQPFAWTAVSFPREGYAWFSLKNPELLNSTLLWMSNGGRYPQPWNGRHRPVLGLEEIVGFYDYSVASSIKAAIPGFEDHSMTVLKRRDVPMEVPFIMAVTTIPSDFGRIETITAVDGGVNLASSNGQVVYVPLDITFLIPAGSLC